MEVVPSTLKPMFAILLPAFLLFLALASGWLAENWLAGVLAFLAWQSCIQAAAYYLGFHLGVGTDVVSGLYAVGLSIGSSYLFTRPLHIHERIPWTRREILMTSVACGVVVACGVYVAITVHAHQTFVPIRSPWNSLPTGVPVAYALSILALILLTRETKRTWLLACATSIPLLTLAAIPIVLYPLGYGFDGFLHRASERILLTTGTLNPKPLYYIGQYVFVTWIARLFHVAHESIDLWLVPTFLVLIPWAFTRRMDADAWQRYAPVALLLFLPLDQLLVSTPQTFAYILGCIALALAVSDCSAALTVPIALWSLVTHPLAGIPFVLLVALVYARRWWLRVPLLLGAIISVPAAFAAYAFKNSAFNGWHVDHVFAPALWESWITAHLFSPAIHISLVADWYSFVEYLVPIICTLCVTIALFRRATPPVYRYLAVASCGLALASPVLSAIGDFSFLIDYERQNYASRLSVLALLVACIPAIEGALVWIRPRAPLATYALVLCGTGVLTAHIIDALPRHDVATVSRAWSVGRDDVDAVLAIDRDAHGAPYTVLANQNVSAVAVDRLGFKRYEKDIFFYPIPTGGPLYALFLRMMKEPDTGIVREAATISGSRLVYVVLNDYWWDADRVRDELNSLAPTLTALDTRSLRVYKFDLSALDTHATRSSP